MSGILYASVLYVPESTTPFLKYWAKMKDPLANLSQILASCLLMSTSILEWMSVSEWKDSQRVMGRHGKYGHYSSILARMEYEYLIQTELNMG